MGTAIAPFFHPLGIDWKGGVALLTGFVAKEIVVSTLGVLYATDDASDPDALQKALLASNFTPLSAFSMMIFVLLYLPCLAHGCRHPAGNPLPKVDVFQYRLHHIRGLDHVFCGVSGW